jgi:DNA-binding MarR family transcriptional regulator
MGNSFNFIIYQILILCDGALMPTEISTMVFRYKHAVTLAVDILEKEGLIRRQVSRGDRRIRKVIITQNGLDFVKANSDETRKMDEKALSCSSQNQAAPFKSMLKRLRKHLLDLLKDSRVPQIKPLEII